jgi:hypothetical protein
VKIESLYARFLHDSSMEHAVRNGRSAPLNATLAALDVSTESLSEFSDAGGGGGGDGFHGIPPVRLGPPSLIS